MTTHDNGSAIRRERIRIEAPDGKGSFGAYLAVPPSGHGPGLVVAQEIFGVNATMREVADHYAEEGYVVLVPDLFWRIQADVELGYSPQDWERAFEFFKKFDQDAGTEDVQASITALRKRKEVDGGKVGVVGYCLGGKLAYLAACRTDSDVSIGYYGVGIEAALDEAKNIRKPLMLHIAAKDSYCPPEAQRQISEGLGRLDGIRTSVHVYPDVDHAFARPNGDHWNGPAAKLAHQRTVEFLKRAIGPDFDLSALWDEHCRHEFATRDVDATMATMVAEPYVNHIPTMTGGVGHDHLKDFYTRFFVNSNPPDTALVPISRTVGATQVVDEMLFSFTHTTEVPWMLPGVKPTGKRVEIPLVAIVKFRGDKLYHEHIYWDQASVLVQIGLLKAEGLPVAGVETGRKLLDEKLPSNTLMPNGGRSS